MGLDMYLYKLPQGDKNHEYEVNYWRKSNAIHRWFTQDAEEDNLTEFPKTIEDIKRLYHLCARSLKQKEPVLETGDGFFWGSTKYDEWYWEDIQETVDALEVIIKHLEEGDEYYYYAWY